MPKTGPYDFLVARKADGYSQDIWDSDTEGGPARIAKREAEANAAAKLGDALHGPERQVIEKMIAEVIKERFTPGLRSLRPKRMITKVVEHDAKGRIVRIE